MTATIVAAISLMLLLGLLTLITVLIADRRAAIVAALRAGAVIADRRAVPLRCAAGSAHSF